MGGGGGGVQDLTRSVSGSENGAYLSGPDTLGVCQARETVWVPTLTAVVRGPGDRGKYEGLPRALITPAT